MRLWVCVQGKNNLKLYWCLTRVCIKRLKCTVPSWRHKTATKQASLVCIRMSNGLPRGDPPPPPSLMPPFSSIIHILHHQSHTWWTATLQQQEQPFMACKVDLYLHLVVCGGSWSSEWTSPPFLFIYFLNWSVMWLAPISIWDIFTHWGIFAFIWRGWSDE